MEAISAWGGEMQPAKYLNVKKNKPQDYAHLYKFVVLREVVVFTWRSIACINENVILK